MDPSLKAVVGAACTQLAGTPEGGRELFNTVKRDCGGYVPHAALLALIAAAEATRVPFIEAPEPS